jgi:hypothetical protein
MLQLTGWWGIELVLHADAFEQFSGHLTHETLCSSKSLSYSSKAASEASRFSIATELPGMFPVVD